MRLRRLTAALTVLLVPLPAAAQAPARTLVGPVLNDPAPQGQGSNFTLDGELRRVAPPRSGLIMALPLRENLQIGVGRFSVPEIAKPKSNIESERAPTSLRSRQRGIAAIGLHLRF